MRPSARGEIAVEQPGEPAAAADAAAVRQGEGLDDDARRHRQRAARPAAVDIVDADGARAGRGQAAPSINLTREQLAIVYKWADGVSTPTPPGHWNFIAAPYIAEAQFSEVRAARAFALLNMAMHDAAVACWDAKFAYFNPRPSQLDPRSERSSACRTSRRTSRATRRFRPRRPRCCRTCFRRADRVRAGTEEAAISRLYGGIHYRTDIEVGMEHGVGGYTVRFALHDGAE